MADAGLVPAQPAPVVAEVPAEAPAEQVAPVVAEATPEAVSSEPVLDVTPPAEAAPAIDVDGVVAATFSLLRAEPDGSVVIAGSGQPGADIQLFANGDLLGETEVEPSGDWVFVPEQPLATGGLEITLGQNGEPSSTDQAFIVVINEDKTTQPLVVASAPGKISEVLQGLVASNAAAGAADADATDDTAVEVAMAPTAAVAAPEAPAAPSEAAPSATETAEPSVDVADAPVAVSDAEPAPTEPSATTSEPVVAQEPVATPEPAAVPVEPATPSTENVVAEPAAPVAPETVEAPAPTEAVPAPAVVAAVIPPTIDAIELEGTRSFFAGAGTNDATIRLYVDDGFIADTTIADGRWLIEGESVLKPGNQRVRIDMLKAGTSEVISRAEVDFVLDVPVEPETVVAEAPAAATAPEPTPAPAQAPAATAEPATPATPAQPVESSAVEQPVAVAEAPAAAPEAAVPTMVAVSLGDPNAQRFASGKAIIRRGDNLWTIARRVYGEGLKYTTIYEANTGQIRDPDRIYPGQVFSLPEAAN
ncbi:MULTISPECIES: LysM peptidoglycan-binding domain-containing protein [unclassified Devosia]|uniref:LysM peptidoglycan-binding domain-containing protein n=1 Tax=unclassified Devosia TaxID=196773 RepID=UPI0018F05EDD|nr:MULTISPECIES: LysM peptidoglycan-binding domain-containing protein [unclassified Devosia]MBJ6987357.1 LysM peptidoglycan-binding domain-containing protein [Devosia sp. MC521]